jgi:hypothetical protein
LIPYLRECETKAALLALYGGQVPLDNASQAFFFVVKALLWT